MLAIIILGLPQTVLAFRSSTNFRIWDDSVGSGGARSTSTNYIVEDTIGESATGEDSSSTNFLADAGFPAIFEEPVLRITLSASAAGLSPNPSPTTTGSTSYTATVATNADFGYTLQVTEDGEFRSGADSITDVSDGTITAGSLEYGIQVSGTDAAFSDDQAISSTPLTVASRTSPTTGTVTTITHQASVEFGTATGPYSHTVTYVAVANF